MKLDSDNMIRTQVSLPADEYELVKQQSRSLGISIAEVIRRAVRDALPHGDGGAWMRFAGFVESGNPKSSQSIDEVVYGEKD
jgi:Ribbon-helix-helix protein, copG family